ncbi:hypothetical protein EXIGLDRAFT_282758 [Exidia glandulosa HHB12029]|uniref:Uncharacterized protein n=1 Tax=Exidia glandulosa HHB12029 TaxID=1314781 RepID=A0A165DIH2_EXIGL|nr:hypothetical protein EXIGLDRAFT_282758 [Exidia glandulosa HHB12029]
MPSLQRLLVEMLYVALTAIVHLGAALLSYTHLYTIDQPHPDTIHRRVLENSLDPEILAAAVRSIRIRAWMPTCHHTSMQDIFEIIRTDFQEDKMGKQRITDAEYCQLVERSRICDELEVVYSRWCATVFSVVVDRSRP